MDTHNPGDYFLVKFKFWHGWKPDLFGLAIKWITKSPWVHAAIYLGDGQIMEARPAGAGRNTLSEYDSFEILWSHDSLTNEQRKRAVWFAKFYAGVPYGWTDIAWLGLYYLTGIRWKWLLRKIERQDRLICSQLVALIGQNIKEDEWLCGQPNPALVIPKMLADRIT